MDTTPAPLNGLPSQPAANATAAAPAIDGIDAGPVLSLLRGDVARYTRLLQTFAQHHAGDVAALQAAAAGSEAPQRCLHGLKGSAATIGAHEVHQLAAAIDDRLRQGAEPATLAAELSLLADTLQRLLVQIQTRLPG